MVDLKPTSAQPFCGICGATFKTMELAEAHYRREHRAKRGRPPTRTKRNIPKRVKPLRFSSDNKEHYRIVSERRRIIKQAFDLIRRDPDQRSMIRYLAHALGTAPSITDEHLQAAHEIIASHSSRQSQPN